MRDFYRRLLIKHVVRVWFPRSIDQEHGGFLCDFDGSWRNVGQNHKQLEFQARQTLFAAELLPVFPENRTLAKAVASGLACIRDQMWDREHGGWYAITDRAGVPRHGGSKHAHGTAYAIQACLATYAATGDEGALQLALDGFSWIDAHARDSTHGGYIGPLARDGAWLSAEAKTHPDLIGTPVGLKDMNVTSDLYEAFVYAVLLGVATPTMHARIGELREIIFRHYVEPDVRPYFYRPDWTPASSYWRPPSLVQTAARLVEDPVGSRERNVEAAHRLFLHAFEGGWSRKYGGLILGCHADRPVSAAEDKDVHWWGQFELLKAAEYLYCLRPRDAQLEAIVMTIRSRIPRAYIDPWHRGITSYPTGSLGWRDRLLRTNEWRKTVKKGDIWKDASHEGRTMLKLAMLSPGNLGRLPFSASSLAAP